VFHAIFPVAGALLQGHTLRVKSPPSEDGGPSKEVVAGEGKVINWCGQMMLEDEDAFETAWLFIALVGTDAALQSVEDAT
jgi:hypothetical protein